MLCDITVCCFHKIQLMLSHNSYLSLFFQSENEVEIAMSSMEHIKDAVATSLLNFVCKEHEISDMVLQLLSAQLHYHESCVQQIKAVLPEMKVAHAPQRPQDMCCF